MPITWPTITASSGVWIAVDWAVTESAMEIYAGRYSVVAMPVKTKKWDYFPEEVQTRMIDNDFTWAANNRTRLITEWRKRYDVKSEPKT